jgi:hypothetical protein
MGTIHHERGTVAESPRDRPNPISLQELLALLTRVRQTGNSRWVSICPAHDDGTASLSIYARDDEPILLHCFAGCAFSDIATALGFVPAQFFPSHGEPWSPARHPRPRIGPDRAAGEYAQRLSRLRRAPLPDRMRQELVAVGRLVRGGAAAFARVPGNFCPEEIQTFPLRLVFQAIEQLAREGSHWRSFPPRVLARVVQRVADCYGYPGDSSYEAEIEQWARLALGMASLAKRTHRE